MDDTPTVALVTGGNQGLGLALVRGLCRRLGDDAMVYLAARDRGRGEMRCKLCAEKGRWRW